MVIVDSITRILPGVLGCAESATRDTFNRDLLKHPQYTRPRCFENNEVPADLLGGNHSRISDYRFTESVRATLKKRPDLLSRVSFSSAEKKLLQGKNLLAAVEKRQAELEKKHG